MGPKILVADDDAWILRMVTTVLEKRGYTVETAVDGEDAYHKAIAAPPDLLITDVMMPKIDGWTLVKTLRARPEFAFVPVIFLTALSSDDDRIRGFRLGADDYLPKPFRFEELDLRVAKTLRRRNAIETDAREQLDAGPKTTPAGGASVEKPVLAGELAQVGISALLTLLEMERKTGVVAVTEADSGAVARLYLKSGRIIHAHLDGKSSPNNAECVYFVISWQRGRFEFHQMEVSVEDEINAATMHLLMEGARRLDEAER